MTRLLASAALGLANALFVWMFLAAAPIEQLADAAGFDEAMRETAYRFAADWRHGMAGNSILYMPGFFALAIAVWLRAGQRPLGRLATEQLLWLPIAAAVAAIVSSITAPSVVAAFLAREHAPLPAVLPSLSLRPFRDGVYTALTWAMFVAGSRAALERRRWRPLVPAALLTAGLAWLRPWTVGDFTSLWIAAISAGDVVAIVSAVAIPVVAFALVKSLNRRGSASPQTAEQVTP